MPFCSQCGQQVGAADLFCYRCGGRQPVSAGPTVAPGPIAGMSPRTASVLCYVPGLGWIASIIVLASHRFRHDYAVRFHAYQGLYLFVAWLINAWVIRPIFALMTFHMHIGVHGLVELALLIMSIFMMVKASHDETYPLPLFGELAQKSVAEH
jgi:uncharacterized membrane protein